MSTAVPRDAGPAGEGGREELVELSISGMHCESCVALVEEALSEEAGVHSAEVDLEAGRVVVRVNPVVVGFDDLRDAVAEVGYTATLAV